MYGLQIHPLAFKLEVKYRKPNQRPDLKTTFQPVDEDRNAFFDHWNASRKTFCDNQLTLFADEIVLLKNVTVNLTKAYAAAKGGEDVSEVSKQAEKSEIFTFSQGKT